MPIISGLQKLVRLKKEIADETEHYRLVLKKYKKAGKVIHCSMFCLGFLTTALSAGAIAASLTGVGIVVGTPIAAIAAFSGAVSTRLTALNKKLERKVNEHTKIHALAVAKHNSINSYMSKSLDNNNVTDLELTSKIQKFKNTDNLKRLYAQTSQKKQGPFTTARSRDYQKRDSARISQKTFPSCSRFEV